MVRRFDLAALAVTAALVGACNSVSPTTVTRTTFDEARYEKIAAMPDDTTKLRELGELIGDYASDRTCTGEGDCRAIGMGEMPCGGPYTYLVYSRATVDTTRLIELVSQYNDLNEEMNVKYHLVGPCIFIPPPEVACLNGQCSVIPK